MRGIRYRLSAMLLLTTVLVAILGVAHWRKNRIIEKCVYFKQFDVEIELPSSAVDIFWQRNPSKAIVRVPSENYSLDDKTLQDDLSDFGIADISYEVQDLDTGNWDDAISDPELATQRE